MKEKERLKNLSDCQNDIDSVQKNYGSCLEELSKSFLNFKQIYTTYENSINGLIAVTEDGLKYSVERVFRRDQFMQKLSNILNNKSFGRFNAFDLNNLEEKDLSLKNIKELIEAILANSKDSLQLKANNSEESALREILTDWNNMHHIVKMDDDNMSDMSPGKKALVLLKLLIDCSESECPILIDQPEDDLDNRSIYDELIKFIREKKVQRQIIVVTHNANIVLGGDAELVIVANQSGEKTPNKDYRFEYRGGSIEDISCNKNDKSDILSSKDIKGHICEILEGGELAFTIRQNKYHFAKN